jgi:hypothetical protein
MTTEVRRTATFNHLENTTAFDVIYKKADSISVSITAEENLIEYILTETRDNILTIKTLPGTRCFDYTDRPVITVTGPNLTGAVLTGSGNMIADEISGETVSIKLTGSGDLNAESVITGNLFVTLSGSGDLNIGDASCENSDLLITGSGSIELNGVCDSGKLKITGSGNINSSDFTIGAALITISGSGNAFTTVAFSLTGILSGSGNIYVRGNPSITQTVTGSGRIIKYK